MSTEARVPGVSAASIAVNAWAPASMSSAVAKYWSTIAVPCSSSCKILRPVVGTPGGGPSDSSMRASSASIRSALTSVNLTTRTYTAATSAFGLMRPYRSAGRRSRLIYGAAAALKVGGGGVEGVEGGGDEWVPVAGGQERVDV